MINSCQTRKKATYSTFTKYCFQKGILSKEIEEIIPRSTRHSWRKQGVSAIEHNLLADFENTGFDYACISVENEKVKSISAALAQIILLYQKIIDNSEAKKQLLRKSKHLLLETINRLKDIFSINQLCAYLGISTRQYYSWKNNNDCRTSLLKLCRKKFATQLSDEDINTIKVYMNNAAFQYLSRATVYWKMIRDGKAMFSKTTFYKYCRLLGYHKRPVMRKTKQNNEG